MAKIQYEIESLIDNDSRLNEIPIKVIIRNQSDTRIKILSIVPNVPNNVEFEEKVDTFQEDSKKKTIDLCQELSLITNNVLIIANQDHRANLVKTIKEVYTELFSSMPNLIRLMYFNQTAFKARMSSFNRQIAKLKYKIDNLEDAKWAHEKIIKDLVENNPERKLFEGKLIQLENLYSKIGELNSNYIALIEPDSFYSRTYVLRFYRRTLSTKIYNISFDSKYADENTNLEFRANVSTSINITPKPFFLTIFAALMSVLGTTLKHGMTHIDKQVSPQAFFMELGNTIITAPGLTSIIIAILFFNIYEYTDIGKKMKMTVNWRVALTVGILSGVFGDRLIEAIKVFIGIN